MQSITSKKQLREFGFLIGLAFPILVGWILPRLGGGSFRIWTLCVGIPALILGIIRPSLLLNTYKFWMSVGHVLGWINSRIILGLIFILIVQPIALIMKLFAYDPLRKNKLTNVNSYREKKENNKIDLTRIF
ncbi:SxtJ family membrane protein [Prochlorococcus marinus]|uniref:SxtJ family membrane protein n=1 Tax=Prochlorococcus marinus TaxID=1219 RepID=UPI0039B039EE